MRLVAITVLLVTSDVTSALAQAEPGIQIDVGFGADGYSARSDNGRNDTYVGLYPELTFAFMGQNGWTTELYLAPELYLSSADTKRFGADDTYAFSSLTTTSPDGLSLGAEYETTFVRENDRLERYAYAIFIASPRFGRISYGDQGSALDEACITASGGTTNFAADDLANLSTCESIGFTDTLRYVSLAFAGRYKIYASTSNPDDGGLDDGGAGRTVSLALTNAGTLSGKPTASRQNSL